MLVKSNVIGTCPTAGERIQFMHKGFKALLFSLTAVALFSKVALAAGFTTNERGQQVYQNDNGSVATNTWIKMTQNGRTEWYYATANGSLRQDGWQKIGENYYYFDGNGMMQTGWVEEDRYYCDPASGKMITGWRQLPLPDGVSAGEGRKSNNNTYWFYFNQSTGEKLYAKNERVTVKTIDNLSYGFDENGTMASSRWGSAFPQAGMPQQVPRETAQASLPEMWSGSILKTTDIRPQETTPSMKSSASEISAISLTRRAIPYTVSKRERPPLTRLKLIITVERTKMTAP